MKMKKLVITLLVSLSLCSVTACGSNNSDDTAIRPLVEIKNIPDGWSKFDKKYCYYYEVDTHIVYVGEARFFNDSGYVKLESEEFEGYIYDLNENEFVGFNR